MTNAIRNPNPVSPGTQPGQPRPILLTLIAAWPSGCSFLSFPLTAPISPREKENRLHTSRISQIMVLANQRTMRFPIPEGEGKGEGERTGKNASRDRQNHEPPFRPSSFGLLSVFG